MEESKVPAIWPLDTKTVRLARNKRIQIKEDEEVPFHEPPTVSAGIKIGMETKIYVPDLEEQQTGFTPFKFVKREIEGSDPPRFEDVAVDATKELMAHYHGIYKRIKDKGEENGD